MIDKIVVRSGDMIVAMDNQYFEQTPKRIYLWQVDPMYPDCPHIVKTWKSGSVLWIIEKDEAQGVTIDTP